SVGAERIEPHRIGLIDLAPGNGNRWPCLPAVNTGRGLLLGFEVSCCLELGAFQPLLLAAITSEKMPKTSARTRAPTNLFSLRVFTTGTLRCSLVKTTGSTSNNR